MRGVLSWQAGCVLSGLRGTARCQTCLLTDILAASRCDARCPSPIRQGCAVGHTSSHSLRVTCMAADEVEKLREDYKLPIRATSDSNGADVVALKQGYLHKKSTGMIKEWKRRYFVLDSMGMLYYYSSKVPCSSQSQFHSCMCLATAAHKLASKAPEYACDTPEGCGYSHGHHIDL